LAIDSDFARAFILLESIQPTAKPVMQ
jgi:hypothetical protein